MVLAPKQGGTDRLCIDYRRLNKVARVSAYPLPRIQQALDALQQKTFFSIFDFPNAYWQIEGEPGSPKYLAFTAPDGPVRVDPDAVGGRGSTRRAARNGEQLAWRDEVGERGTSMT